MENEEGTLRVRGEGLSNKLFKQHLVKVTIPRNVLYWLILWAKVSGRKKNPFASQIIISRVNDNILGIQSALEKWAKMDSVDVDFLIQSILEEEGFPFLESPEIQIVIEESDEIE